jgi:hypothetical protein
VAKSAASSVGPRARIARGRVPRVLGDHGLRIALDGLVEQGRVEGAEVLADLLGHVEVGGDGDVRVVGDGVALALGENVYDEILRALRVHEAEAYG